MYGLMYDLRLFADDCVLYRVIKSDEDHHIRQSDLNIDP